ncbi:MAG: hypothetical protein WAR79_04495 [Melioribacteraceae bacterium]
MKKLLTLLVFTIFVFAGCQDDNSILEPENSKLEENLQKIDADFQYDDLDVQVFPDSVDTLKIKDKFSKKLTVNGTKGGKVSFSYTFKNKRSKTVKLEANLEIPKNAYQGDLTFDIIFDLENLGVELYPSPFTFDKPVILDLKFSNTDLKEFELKDLTFDYLDGEPENLVYEKVNFDVEKGNLEIKGAQIPHFSRYGWTRTK